jgi:17beta-estradiol 17-dehydrogenase / very-long-chain 3-oxoacyl-CoA reductase
MNIILVGRNSPALGDIADDIKAECKEVKVEFIEADFSKGHNVYKAIETGLVGKDIGILVNNVGVIPPHPMYFTEVILNETHRKFFL